LITAAVHTQFFSNSGQLEQVGTRYLTAVYSPCYLGYLSVDASNKYHWDTHRPTPQVDRCLLAKQFINSGFKMTLFLYRDVLHVHRFFSQTINRNFTDRTVLLLGMHDCLL